MGGGLFAQEWPQYTTRFWQVQDGLPHNAVYSLLQTKDGYLWVGTEQGLARFDGQKFSKAAKDGIHEAPIRALLETSEGALCVGSDAGLISVSAGEPLFALEKAAPAGIRTLLRKSDGLWIGSTNGLLHYQGNQIRQWTTQEGLPDNTVLALCADQKNTLWIGTARGLASYDGVSFKHHDFVSGAIRALFCDHEGSLWVGTSDGLLRLKDEQISPFRKNEGLPDNLVRMIFEDSRNQLWIGTMSGLCRLRGEKFAVESNADGSHETVFCMLEDREGSLWVGTKEGLTQLRFKPFHSYTRRQGLPHNNIMSVCEDSSGTLWAASWGGGVSLLRNGEFVTYNYANSRIGDVLLSMRETRDGSLWIGTDFDGGLFRWDTESFTHYGKELGFVGPAARVIYEDRQRNLWIGTSGGLYLKAQETFQRFTASHGLASSIIRTIHQDADDNLWIGTSEGLNLFQDGKFLDVTKGSPLQGVAILSIHEDKDRLLWLGTDGGGLCKLKVSVQNQELEKNFSSRFTIKDGLLSDNIYEILEDERGYLWMSCFSGVFRVKKSDIAAFERGTARSIACASYGKDDGLSSVQCNGVAKPAGWKGKDGRLWFPTTRGVVVVDPDAIRENSSPPPVVVENVIADKKRIQELEMELGKTGKRENGKSHSLVLSSSRLLIPPGRGELEFHYTALSFRAPEKNRFKYKLKNFDKDWVDAGTRRVAYYNNLRPGSYTFQVIGCNNDGVWNETGASLGFVLLPHFWQTKWFAGLVALVSIGLVVATTRYVLWKNVQRQLERLEQQHAVEKERTRIAQDMHDELGARLTEIQMLSDRGQDSLQSQQACVSISDATRDMARNLDAIVWAVNPRNDSLRKMAAYISNYVVKYLAKSSIQCRLDLPESWPDRMISSEMRHNVFLVVKEAANNIVKHSQASEVRFRAGFSDETLTIAVEDDGRGFSPTTAADAGNGLQNMQKRIESIGGRFILASVPGKGTRVELTVPLHR